MMDCSTSSHHQRQPVAARSVRYTKGSQFSVMLNSRIISSPVKNVGSEKPMKATVLAVWSNSEYGRAAASTPTGIATATASNWDAPMTASVTGRRCRMRLSTSMRLVKENPQFPCSMASSQWK